MAPALLGCWIEGGAGFFLFGVIAWRRRRATGSIAAGTWRRRASPGWLNVELSLPIFRLDFIPWRGSAGFHRRSGWHPRCWGVGSRAAPAFFFLALLPGGAVELPGRSRPAPGGVELRRGGSMSSSRCRFSGWTLSLGEGLPDSTGARDGTRAAGVLDRGRRRLFSFWRYCLAAPSSYRVDRGRHLAASSFAGVAQCRALAADFPAGLYPLARVCRIPPALGMAPALLGCWIEGGAGFFNKGKQGDCRPAALA